MRLPRELGHIEWIRGQRIKPPIFSGRTSKGDWGGVAKQENQDSRKSGKQMEKVFQGRRKNPLCETMLIY